MTTTFRLPTDCGDGVVRSAGHFTAKFPIIDPTMDDLELSIEAISKIRHATRDIKIVFDWRTDWYTRTPRAVHVSVPFLSPYMASWLERNWLENHPYNHTPYQFTTQRETQK